MKHHLVPCDEGDFVDDVGAPKLFLQSRCIVSSGGAGQCGEGQPKYTHTESYLWWGATIAGDGGDGGQVGVTVECGLAIGASIF